MIAQADLSVRAPDGSTVAIIEVKNRENLTAERATELRNNMLARGLASTADYFLIVSQDHAYLWRTEAYPDPYPESLPDYHWPMAGIVERYAPDRSSDDRLYGDVLEWIIVLWINELSVDDSSLPHSIRKSLEDSGFLEAVRGGIVRPEVGH